MRILVMGLPGAGKTTLAKELASKIPAVHFDADEVREHLGDPGFSHEGRIIQARRMAWLCSIAERAGHPAVASFVCPTEETRAAFGATYTVFVNRISEGRYADTNALFCAPRNPDYRVDAEKSVGLCVWEIMGDLGRLA